MDTRRPALITSVSKYGSLRCADIRWYWRKSFSRHESKIRRFDVRRLPDRAGACGAWIIRWHDNVMSVPYTISRVSFCVNEAARCVGVIPERRRQIRKDRNRNRVPERYYLESWSDIAVASRDSCFPRSSPIRSGYGVANFRLWYLPVLARRSTRHLIFEP